MLQNTFVFVSLFSFSFLIFLPLNKKEIGLNNEDICYYKNGDEYVKACNKGFFCYESGNLGFCQEYIPAFKKYYEECNDSKICDINLECTNKICLGKEGNVPYIYTDPFSEKKLYYCSDDKIAISEGNKLSTNPLCKNNDMNDKCYISSPEKWADPGFMKVCGKMEFKNNIIYSISISDIGLIEDNNYVYDELACKSGFALPYSLGGSSTQADQVIKLCATFKGAEKRSLSSSSSCIIRYALGEDETEYIYNDTSEIQSIKDFNDKICNYLVTKVKISKDYLDKYKELKNECLEKKYFDEPFTCRNDELRKLWIYYNKPEYYLLYRNDNEVIDYLIEKNYPTPKSIDDKNKKASSGFFNIKYFLLFILLSL